MNTKCNIEDFIEKSKKLYGDDSFDYSLVKYVNEYTEITLICKTHGEFTITPNKHLKIICGCPKCSKEKRKKRCKMSNEKYKDLVIKKHGDKYDLTKTFYNGMRNYVTADCKKHGEFKIVAYDFVNKRGCPKCGREEKKKVKKETHTKGNLTTDIFIEKANKIFNNYYSYEKTDLKNKDKHNRVCITCPKHGDFMQNPYSHLNGHGCEKCGKERMAVTQKITNEEFIEKANKIHNFKYKYNLSNYKGSHSYIEIICPIHGKFIQKAYSHLSGHGCKKCAIENSSQLFLSNTEEFIKKANKIHNNEENYNFVKYINAKEPVTIVCKNGHIYSQMPNKHLSGHGCPYCINNVSNPEKEIAKYIETLGFEIKRNIRNILNDSKEIDLYISDKRVGIEYNGLYWHSELKKNDKDYHLKKTKECEKQNIQLIQIFEDEWINHEDIVKSNLKKILGKTEQIISYKDCIVKEIKTEDYKQFLLKNDINGYIKTSFKYGLFYKDEIVSVIGFNIKNKKENREFKIIRYCDKINFFVQGGSKLFLDYFITKEKPSSIIVEIDRRWCNKNYFEQSKFKYVYETKPNYYYIIGQQRYNKFQFKKEKLVKQGFDKNKTEHEIMTERGIYRIYDCGAKVYKWKNDNF